jgi:hypothetical protein
VNIYRIKSSRPIKDRYLADKAKLQEKRAPRFLRRNCMPERIATVRAQMLHVTEQPWCC